MAAGRQVALFQRAATLLRTLDVTVVEHPGWKTRGSSAYQPRRVVGHWTGGLKTPRGLLANGRSDLTGPLCQLNIAGRTVVLIAAGRANHAGRAKPGWSNSLTVGIETNGPPFDKATFDTYHKTVAVLCYLLGTNPAKAFADHHSIALPFGRKPDFSTKYNLATFVKNVQPFYVALVRSHGHPRPIRVAVALPGWRLGSKGQAVSNIQQALRHVGWRSVVIDGVYGASTARAVLGFQQARNLPRSGLVDVRTAKALGLDSRGNLARTR